MNIKIEECQHHFEQSKVYFILYIRRFSSIQRHEVANATENLPKTNILFVIAKNHYLIHFNKLHYQIDLILKNHSRKQAKSFNINDIGSNMSIDRYVLQMHSENSETFSLMVGLPQFRFYNCIYLLTELSKEFKLLEFISVEVMWVRCRFIADTEHHNVFIQRQREETEKSSSMGEKYGKHVRFL